MVVRTLEKLARLPIRHQEEAHRQPVAKDGDVERGKKNRGRTSQLDGKDGDDGKQGDIPSSSHWQRVTGKCLHPRRHSQDDGKPDLNPL